MPETVLPKPLPLAFTTLMRTQGLALHAKDQPPGNLKAAQDQRARLQKAMLAAMGPFPEKPCPLTPSTTGTLKRQGYRIEKVVFQSRPDVWVTSSLYVPDPAKAKLPA